MHFRYLLMLAVILSCLNFSVQAKDIQTHGEICPYPAKPCSSSAYEFKPNELSFHLPAQLEWQSRHYSANFYAVILRSVKTVETHGDEICKGFIEEFERLAVQEKFLEHKVFTSRNGCASMVYYTKVNDKYNFIAVYAGASKTEATAIITQAKVAGFPDASLRKMQIVVDNGD